MNNIGRNSFDLGYMDTLASGDSMLHRLDPRAKLITTLMFIITVVSFDRYAVSAMIPFFIFPVTMLSLGGLPAGYLMKKVLVISPFAVLVGIFNPLMDRGVMFEVGSIDISGGWVSFISILLRFALTVTAALVLVSLTGFNAVCEALIKFRVPKVFVTQLLFFYRYIFVLIDEAERMVRARSFRAVSPGGMGFGTFVPLVGNLLLRTLDRAERVYRAMRCRGFDGHIRVMRTIRMGPRELLFMAGWMVVFGLCRCLNIPLKIGEVITGLIK